jgi:hypothetical protein
VENQLYIRMRGRVLGPYDQEKLRSLARHGQLSRMHELSTDATNWVQASTYPELFISTDVAPTEVGLESTSREVRESGRSDGQLPRSCDQRWWYRKNNSDTGPIDETTLQQMLASGNLGLDALVWTDGMPQWIPARQVPSLSSIQGASWRQDGRRDPAWSAEQKSGLPANLYKAASMSRFWVVFIAVVVFVYAGLAIVGGIFALIEGASHHSPPVVAWGLFALILAIDVAAGGFLLSSYASNVARLKSNNDEVALERALDTLRTFWIYISINLIVYLAFVLFVLIWAIAVAGSFPWTEGLQQSPTL